MSSPRVAVIGGGLAGLAAAVKLRRLGVEPVVFESAPEVGGVVKTIRRDGWVFDTGAAMAGEPAPVVRELLDSVGIDSVIQRAGAVGATRYIVLNGAPVVLPRTTSEFTSSSLLTLGGRLRLLKERLIPARQDAADESVDSFARRRFGDEMAERMFDPLIASTCAGDARGIIARYAFPNLVGHERGAGSSLQGSARARMEARRRAKGRPTGSWSCAGGMQQLPRQLATHAGDVRTGASVERVSAASNGLELSVTRLGTERFDAAIIAVPARGLTEMRINVPASDQISQITSMPHASIATVSLGFRRDQISHPLDASRLLVPTVERRDVLSMVFPASVFPDRAPEHHVLITAFVGGALRPELLDRDDADLIALVEREVGALLGVAGAPVISHVTRWRDALPQAVAGHGNRLAAADAIESAESRIAFTGSWRDGLAIGEVLLGGVHAADRLAARCGWSGQR